MSNQTIKIYKFNILKLKDKETNLQYHVRISNRFDALRTSNEDAREVDVNYVWENIRDIKVQSHPNSMHGYRQLSLAALAGPLAD